MKYIRRAREILSEANKAFEELARANYELRVEGLQRAVDEGWFKHFLIGAGIVGAGLACTGLSVDDNFVAGLGYGILAMDTIYASVL